MRANQQLTTPNTHKENDGQLLNIQSKGKTGLFLIKGLFLILFPYYLFSVALQTYT